MHRERQLLVTQWQDAIAAMKRRDEARAVACWVGDARDAWGGAQEIARAAGDYATAAAALEARKNELREYQHRMESQQTENAVRRARGGMSVRRVRGSCVCACVGAPAPQEVQASITAADRTNTKVREDFQRLQLKLNEFKDEVEVLKNELQKAANDLLQRRCVDARLCWCSGTRGT